MGLGGQAEVYARVTQVDGVAAALDWAARRSLPVSVLGGGSNVVVADAGVKGLVLTLRVLGQSVVVDGPHVDVYVGAGESWDLFVAQCVDRNWAGVECLSGIPGQVGATPIQNVGAYGQDVSGTLSSVDVYDRVSRRRRELAHGECEFGYRTSRFKGRDAGRFIVLGAKFRLHEGGPACLRYPEIAKRLAAVPGQAPSLQSLRSAVLATRREKSMLLDAGDENARSCGSFFLNPELTNPELEELASRCSTPPPRFLQADGRVKVPAAWLIEQAGFARGQRFGVGTVGISSRHTLALVCHDGATAAHLVEAAHCVRDKVAEAFAIWLTPEPSFLGFGGAFDGLPPLS